ncbi:MAG: MFS transporter, partial [Cyanobacteria bacterium]|nr:MFS transporter [Cyanobacteriota bacterium]
MPAGEYLPVCNLQVLLYYSMMQTYVLLVIASLFCEISINLPVGSLPLALTEDGATANQVSIAMGSGMFAAFIVSLPLGALVDRIGRLPVLKLAAFGSGIIMVAMWCSHGVLSGCLEMALRSILLVAYMTAMFAYASNIFSRERMVSAVASLGIIGNLALATGPAIGVYLWQHGIRHEQYLYSSILNLVAAISLLWLPRNLDVKPAVPRPFRIDIDRSWFPAMAFILCCSMQGGVSFSLAVLEFHARGITNGALLFTCSAFTTVLLRYVAGRLVETLGARRMAAPTAFFLAGGSMVAAVASDSFMVALAGVLLGTAWAAVPPIGIALLFENCPEGARGKAMGSYNLSMSGGFGLGSFLATVATACGYGYTHAIL